MKIRFTDLEGMKTKPFMDKELSIEQFILELSEKEYREGIIQAYAALVEIEPSKLAIMCENEVIYKEIKNTMENDYDAFTEMVLLETYRYKAQSIYDRNNKVDE